MRASALLVAGVLVAILLAGAASAAMSMEQAKKAFEAKGCTGCHNGGLAPTFEGTVKKIQEWAKKYNSLDEAVKAEAKNFKMFQNAQSWDQLMNMMNVPGGLRKFFEQVFQQAKGGAGGAAPATTAAPSGGAAAPAATVTTTVTQTVVKTVTQTVTEKVLITETVTPVNVEPGTGQLIAKASYVVAILIAVAVVALAYMFYAKK